jgi:hypothetical protein
MKNIDPLAIHEAAHFIVYLLNCKEENIYARVEELSLIPRNRLGPAYIKVNSFTFPESVEYFLKSDIVPQKEKEEERYRVKKKIIYLLAGIAGELVQLGVTDYRRALTIFYSDEKRDNNSDLSKAIAFNIVVGEQLAYEGVQPLLKPLNEALQYVLNHWNNIISIAELLQIKRQFTTEELQCLVEEYTVKL